MALPIPPLHDPDFLYEVADTFRHELDRALLDCSAFQPHDILSAVTMPDPPMDDCPGLVVWVDRVLPWTGQVTDDARAKLGCATGWLIQLTGRIHRCYDTDPDRADSMSREEQARALYRDAGCWYMNWFCARAICQDPEDLFYEMQQGPLVPISESGLAAGWQFSITLTVVG